VAGFPEINKHGGSNKSCSWENFLKKNKKNSMLIRDFRVLESRSYLFLKCLIPTKMQQSKRLQGLLTERRNDRNIADMADFGF
jgi:hypothetical protein